MHIVRLTKTLPPMPGGMERHVLRLSEEQAKRHQVTVLYARGDPPPSRENLRFIRLNVPVWHNRYLYHATATNLAALAVLSNLHMDKPIDILHAHGDIIELVLLPTFTGRHRIPLVLTIHGTIRPTIPMLSAWSYHRADHLIAVGSDIKKTLRELRIPKERISIISSGIDYDQFANPFRTRGERLAARKRFGVADWQYVLVFAGRLTAMKGVSYLLSALPEIQRRVPGTGLLIAGDGPDRKRLEGLARGVEMVVFAGTLNRPDLVQALHLGDLFVLPSITLKRTAEGVATAAMEGMAAGLPVVSSDTGSMVDLIRPENGLLFPEKDTDALARACVELLEDDERRSRIVMTNCESAKQKDWSVIAGQIEAVYEKVLQGKQ